MTPEQQRVRRITVTALDLSRDPDPDDQLSKILSRIAKRYGEDPIREYIRMTALKGKSPTEAATYIYGDGAVGQQLSIAINRIDQSIQSNE